MPLSVSEIRIYLNRFSSSFVAVQNCQAEITGWLTEHLQAWLTPHRAAGLKAVLVSAGIGFLLGSWVFLIWTVLHR
jgi:hypothetical protein